MEQPKGHHLDDDERRQLDELANIDDIAAPISYWAHVFALELARLNDGKVSLSMTMHRYAQALTKAALDGSLAVSDALTMMRVSVNEQTNETHPDYLFNEVRVTKSDLHAWVVETGAALRTRLLGFTMYNEQQDGESHPVMPVPDAESAPVTSSSDSDWKEQARVIANAIGLEKWNLGIRQISARSICDAVATRLGENQKCWGTQGPRASNAVRSVALKGWKFIQPGGTNGTNGINE